MTFILGAIDWYQQQKGLHLCTVVFPDDSHPEGFTGYSLLGIDYLEGYGFVLELLGMRFGDNGL